jgi:hypothetical protein
LSFASWSRRSEKEDESWIITFYSDTNIWIPSLSGTNCDHLTFCFSTHDNSHQHHFPQRQ